MTIASHVPGVYFPAIMRRDSPEERALIAHIQTLYAQLGNVDPGTPEYERLCVQIHELSVAYGKLADAKPGVEQSDKKP